MLKCTICFQKCATRSLERGDSLVCVCEERSLRKGRGKSYFTFKSYCQDRTYPKYMPFIFYGRPVVIWFAGDFLQFHHSIPGVQLLLMIPTHQSLKIDFWLFSLRAKLITCSQVARSWALWRGKVSALVVLKVLATQAYYRKRRSASYIVREVLSVRERERERERERDTEKDGSDVTIIALKLAMSLHFPLPKIRTNGDEFAVFVSPFTLPVSPVSLLKASL